MKCLIKYAIANSTMFIHGNDEGLEYEYSGGILRDLKCTELEPLIETAEN